MYDHKRSSGGGRIEIIEKRKTTSNTISNTLENQNDHDPLNDYNF